MKLFLIFCISVLSSVAAYAVNDEAIIYNDKIVGEQNKIGEAILAFSNNANEFSLEQVQKQAEASLAVLNSMKPFEGNKELLGAAKNLFKFYISITKNEYKKMLDLIINKDKYSEEELTKKINALSESLTKKEQPLDAKFQAAQAVFAKKYNFTLTKNQLEEKLNGLKEE